MKAPEVERLITLYMRILELQDRANAEAYAGDDALAGGYGMAAEQHHAFSHSYRKGAAEKAQEATQLLRELELRYEEAKVSELDRLAQLEARRCLYGSAEVVGRLYVD